MTKQQIHDFFASPAHPSHRRFEAMRAFFFERHPAREVAERFGFSLSAVYNMTRHFAQLDDPAAAYFRNPAPRGRPVRRLQQRLRQRIVQLRQRNLSVPDIKALLDAEEARPPSERVIGNVLREEGFARLPRRTRSQRLAVSPPTLSAPASVPLDPEHVESFRCKSAAGVLCLLPWIRRYGIDRAIEQAGFPGSAALPSVLSFLALKLASVHRYSCDDMWCMERGLGLFAGLNVLPNTAWFSSYSDRVVRPMSQRLLASLAGIWSQHGIASDAADLEVTTICHWRDGASPQGRGSRTRDASPLGLSVALAKDPDSGLLLRTAPSIPRASAAGEVREFLDFFRRHGPAVRYLAFDSRFTTYAGLSRLDRDGVLFVTVRRRGRRLVERARALAAAERRQIRVPLALGTHLIEAYDAPVRLRGFGGKLRQITVWRGPSRRPSLLLTNDFDSSLAAILRRYARRWLVEKSISEQLAFFHLNRPSSSMVIKVDFDLAMTVLAYNLYRLLALDLPPGHRHLTARTLFEQLLSTGATVRLDRDTCTVALKNKPSLPALLETLHAQDPVTIPWLGNRQIVFRGVTRS